MASSSTEQEVTGEDDSRDLSDGKDKKKKLKPLEAFRKLFSKSTRKRGSKKDDGQVSIVSLKAKSTTALDSGQLVDEIDDDGGFSNTRTLHGTRSISEDSVFNPELKETNPESLKKIAVSEENIHQSSLQAELNAKLKGRLSVYSDDDADDGLPHSPTPPTTTADIIMGGGLKPLPMSGKSMSRESDLISEDASDEEDTFNREWRSSVASVQRPKKQSSPTKEEKAMIDLSSVQSTQVLDNKLSKDRLLVKPLRRSRGQSRKKHKEERSTTPLPDVKEESPTKPDVKFEDATKEVKLPEISSSKAAPSKGITAPTPLTKPTVTPKPSSQADSVTKPSITPKAESVTKPAVMPKTDGVTKPAITPKTEGVTKPAITPKIEGVSKSAITPKPVVNKHSLPSDSVTKPTVTQKSSSQIDIDNKLEATGKTSSQSDHKSSVSSSKNEDSVSSPGDSELSNVFSKLKKPKSESENVENSSRDTSETKDNSVEGSETKDNRNSEESSNLKKPNDTTTIDEPKKGGINLRTTDNTDSITSSPKEDYKLKRQNRSKTLPVAAEILKEDQPVVSVQRANSQRVEPDVAPKITKRQSVVLPLTATNKQNESKRLSWVEPTKAASSGQPDWLANLKKKKALEKEEKSPSPTEEKKRFPEKEKSPTEEIKTIVVDNKEENVVMRKKSVGESKPSAVAGKSPTDVKPIEKPAESTKTTTSQIPERKSSIGGSRPMNISVQPAKSEPVKSDSPTTPVAGNSIASRINSLKSSGGDSSKAEKSTVTTPTTETKTPAPAKPSVVVKPTPISKPTVTITKPSPVSKPNTTHAVTKPDVTPTAVTRPITSSHIVTKPIATTTSTATKPATTPVISKPLSTTTPSSRFTGPVSTVKTPSSFKSVESSSSTSKPVLNLSKSVPAKAPSPLKESQPKIATSTASDVPAWRRNISTKKSDTGDIKIELIENSSPLPKTEKKVESSNSSSTNTESPTEKWPDANNRKSKVLDMVKNFQKFEVS